jgi:Mg2+-importing ATPase
VGLAYVQEHRSSQAVEKLHAMVQTNCLVMRDAKECDIPMTEIVPGDIVILQAGALIPADLRLIGAKDFFVGQSNKRLLSEDLLHVAHFALDFAGDLLSRPAVP